MPRRPAKTYHLPPELVARVKRILCARTETEAIVRALQEQVLEQDKRMVLQGRDSGAFLDALRNPPPPSARLAAASRRHGKR